MIKKLPIILLLGMLTACKTVAIPVTAPFPEAPTELTKSCEDLKELADNAKLSDLISTVTDNYTKYHECKAKDQAWIDWYNQQKTIFDGATKGSTTVSK